MSVTLAHSIWTALLLLIFIGIIVWAWSGKRRRRFEEAARLPLEDDDHVHHRPVPPAQAKAGSPGVPRAPGTVKGETEDG